MSGVYFVKRDAQPLPEGNNVNFSDYLAFGDIHPNVLGKKIFSFRISKITSFAFKGRVKKIWTCPNLGLTQPSNPLIQGVHKRRTQSKELLHS